MRHILRNCIRKNIVLNKLGLLGFIIALVLFAIYIRFWMDIANYIGTKFTELFKFVLKLLKKSSS